LLCISCMNFLFIGFNYLPQNTHKMKKISTILFAFFAIITVNAKGNFDNSLVSKLVTPGNTYQGIVKKGITIMPNAETKDIKVIFKADKEAKATIVVLDEAGKKVLNQDALLNSGNNNINVNNFHTLNEGTYTIQLISNNETYTSKFMIWN
jgi:hypothetical protein